MSNVLEVTAPTTSSFLNKSPSLQRKNQLSSWVLSPTNKEKSDYRNSTYVNFSLDTCFLSACGNGDIDDAKAILEKGANVNAENVDGITSLIQACLDDNADVLEFLLQNNANVNAQDLEGWTALHAAAYCGYTNLVETLIQHGADPGVVNSNGELPLDLAEDDSISEILRKVLQEKDIDVEEARDRERQRMLGDISELRGQHRGGLKAADFACIREPITKATPLHVAAAKGYIDVISALLECSTGILEATDIDGWTALHAAAHWGQKEAVRLLVEAGANLDATNAAMQTPADLAEADMTSYIRQLKEKFGVKLRRNAAQNILDNAERKSTLANRRSSVNRLSMDQKMLMRMNKEKSPVAANMMEKMLKKRLSNSPLLDESESSDAQSRPHADPTLKVVNPTRSSDSLSPCPSPMKSPKSPRSPRSPMSPLTLPKMGDIFGQEQSPDMHVAHSALASHFLGVCVLPLTQNLDTDPSADSEAKTDDELAESNKACVSDPRCSLRSFASIESEEPSMIVHDDEAEVGTGSEDTPAVSREPPLIQIPEVDEPVRRRSGQQSPRVVTEEQEDYVPSRRSKINSLIVKSSEDDWRLHRNAISEYDEESETVRRISLLMAPEKSDTSESQRSFASRQALSNRRSTQGELDPLKPKFSALKPIEEVKSITRLEALEMKFVALERSNLELQKQVVDLLKDQELQRRTAACCLAENEALRDRIKALEQEHAAMKQQNTMEELKGENSKLRDENSSLVRVISRLSRSRDHEEDACHRACERCDEHFGAYIANMTRL